MAGWRSAGSRGVVALVVLLGILGLTVSGREAKVQDDVLQSLLLEVKALRLAMEQVAAAGPRVQLAMGRLQLQEQRVESTRHRLDGVRDAITSAERDIAETRDRMAMMEEAGQRAADPAEREGFNGQLRLVKAALVQKAADVQRLKEQEAELTGALAAEESRWTEVSQRLDELERALAPRK